MDTTTLTYLANTTEDMQKSLRIRQSADPQDTDSEDSKDSSGLAVSSDTVTISEQGKRLSGQAVQKIEEGDDESTQTSTEMRIERLEDRIEEIQQEIEEVQGDSELTDDEKLQKTQALTAELLQVQQELAELQSQGGATGGGTPAEGFANSLT